MEEEVRHFSAVAGVGRTYSRRDVARVAAEVGGHVELAALLRSLSRSSFTLNECSELALLELNIIMKNNQRDAPAGLTLPLKSSHSWTRSATQKVLEGICAAVKTDPVSTLVRHLVQTTYPCCSAAAAAKIVFQAPPWLQPWCERYHVEASNVVALELTLFDALGRASNVMLFPLLGEENYHEKDSVDRLRMSR